MKKKAPIASEIGSPLDFMTSQRRAGVSGRFLRISARLAGAFLKKENINLSPRIRSAGP
jgi:hypothetical protein